MFISCMPNVTVNAFNVEARTWVYLVNLSGRLFLSCALSAWTQVPCLVYSTDMQAVEACIVGNVQVSSTIIASPVTLLLLPHFGSSLDRPELLAPRPRHWPLPLPLLHTPMHSYCYCSSITMLLSTDRFPFHLPLSPQHRNTSQFHASIPILHLIPIPTPTPSISLYLGSSSSTLTSHSFLAVSSRTSACAAEIFTLTTSHTTPRLDLDLDSTTLPPFLALSPLSDPDLYRVTPLRVHAEPCGDFIRVCIKQLENSFDSLTLS